MEQTAKTDGELSRFIKEYYGKVLTASKDLKTGACCDTDAVAPHLKGSLLRIHPEITERFYGCGSPIPFALEGTHVLDLGCGTGRDCYLLSQLVGPQGSVTGVDMTDEQLATAGKYVDHHTGAFGYAQPNVRFLQGYIEDLAEVGIPDNSMDLVVSNCVINLSPAKERVFAEIFRVLKPGGELLFSDVFSDRRMPPGLARDPLLVGECLGGAMYTEDFRRLLMRLGYNDARTVSKTSVTLDNPEIETKAGMIGFYSITVRAFKLPHLEDRCEDFGQVAYYLGTIPESPHLFVLDDHHTFKKGLPVPVCSNTASMIAESRYARHFRVDGDTKTHYGLFDCNAAPTHSTESGGIGCC